MPDAPPPLHERLTATMRNRLRDYRPAPVKYDCDHVVDGRGACRLRRIPGKVACVLQCLRCGRQGPTISKEKVELQPADIEAMPPLDVSLAPKWKALVVQRRLEKRSVAERSMEALYASPWWQWARSEVILRENGICQGCRCAEATQVHHKRYFTDARGRRVGGEPLQWLVALCDACHQPGTEDRWQPNYSGRRGPLFDDEDL